MKEIKFRGKSLYNGKYIVGLLLTNKLGTYIITEKNPHECSQYGYLEINEYGRVDPETVGQYTGLKDKNGKKIFEGDIVRQEYHKVIGPYDDPETFSGHHIGEVVIIASKGVCLRNPLCYADETTDTERSNQYKTVAGYRCEVIGNIYENADLLELARSAPESTESLSVA